MTERAPVTPHNSKRPVTQLLPQQIRKAKLPWFDGFEGLILAGGAVTSMVVQSLLPPRHVMLPNLIPNVERNAECH